MAEQHSPLEQFAIHTILDIRIAHVDISFTNSALFMALGIGLVLWFFDRAMARPATVPGRLQAAGEVLYGFGWNLVRDNIGEEGRKFFPFVFTMFLIVLMGNLLGMIPYSFTYTSHIIVTGTLALIVITVATAVGFLRHGLHFLEFFVPHGVPVWLLPLLVPIEVISYLARPVSLSIRLFANMMAGHTMLKVFAGFSVSMGLVFGLVPLALNVALMGFELMVALLQSYVFAILTCIYIRDAIEMH